MIITSAPQLRLSLGKKMGADEVVSIEKIAEDERIEHIKELTEGRGADVVIEAAGAPAAVPEGMKMCRDGGTYVIVGQYTDNGSVEINPHLDINKKHLDIRGCWGCDFSHLYKAIGILSGPGEDFPIQEAISAYYSLNQASKALSAVENLMVVKAVIDPKR